VSDVSLSNASTTISDAHVAYTTWEFSWPEQGSLDDALRAEANATVNGGNVGSCAFVFTTLFPQQVSSAWNPDSSDCISALGSDCVAALKMDIASSSGCRVGFALDTVSKACASSFGAVGDDGWGVSPLGMSFLRSQSRKASHLT
jgi:hypothetical protein